MSSDATRNGDPGPAAARPKHIPVLLHEVMDALRPKAGETYIDGTFGAGGYSRAILEAADCSVLALDRDITAVRAAAPMTAEFPNRLTVVEARFGALDDVARVYLSTDAIDDEPSVFAAPDGVVLDIGVSSMQIDSAERGFSFQNDGSLDMRMSAAIDPLTGTPSDLGRIPSAADVVNTFEEEQLANLIYEFGEEHRSRTIARAIVRQRAEKPFARTRELADVVSRALGGRRDDPKHPATRTFQALRIFVNDELGELEQGLEAAERILKPGGRLVVVTFHSLEDRIVKQFLAERAGKEQGQSRHLPPQSIKFVSPSFRIFNSRPLTPQKGELDVNPRARSARLRVAIRTEAAPHV